MIIESDESMFCIDELVSFWFHLSGEDSFQTIILVDRCISDIYFDPWRINIYLTDKKSATFIAYVGFYVNYFSGEFPIKFIC